MRNTGNVSLVQWVSVLFMALLTTVCLADTKEAESLIRAAVAQKLPNVQIESVTPTAIDHLYQVALNNGEIIHIHDSGRYILSGDMFELVSPTGLKNLTEAYRSTQRVSLIDGLSEQQMVTFAASGETKGQIYVFTDTDCGYCRKFHNEVPELNRQGVEVHYLAWPRSGVASRTGDIMKKIWCSDDPQGAMTLAKQGRPVPSVNELDSCKHPMSEQLALGAKLGVRGTPAVFLPDGRKIGGYMSAQDLLGAMGL